MQQFAWYLTINHIYWLHDHVGDGDNDPDVSISLLDPMMLPNRYSELYFRWELPVFSDMSADIAPLEEHSLVHIPRDLLLFLKFPWFIRHRVSRFGTNRDRIFAGFLVVNFDSYWWHLAHLSQQNIFDGLVTSNSHDTEQCMIISTRHLRSANVCCVDSLIRVLFSRYKSRRQCLLGACHHKRL